MDEDTVVFPILAASFGVIFTIYTLKKWIQSSGNIPGPMGWPLIGHLHYLNPPSLHSTMSMLIKKYGPVFKLRLGSFDTVVITDYMLIKKAFRTPELSNRPTMYIFELVSQGNNGLGSSNGHLWIEQRRFALQHLRDLGMGKSSIEIYIQHEALAMIDLLKKSVGQPIDLNHSLNIAITNIIWAIVAGQRMDYDDPVFLGFIAAMKRNMKLATRGIIGFIPWLKDAIPQSWTGVNLIEESLETINNYFKDIIAAHKNAFDSNDLRDYTDYFIDEQIRRGENSTFTDKQLVVSMGDLFVAGGETVATTLRWAVLLLAHYPEVQRKMQNEIDSIVGKDRRPTLDDREHMSYVDAVIHEIQRFADVTPLGIFHASNEDVDFEGFTIKKDTMVMGYVGDIHRSYKYWMKPEEFYPEHFLDENGLLRRNVEGYLPFSTGKRQCIGENLARAELFIFITYFFQAYNFSLCENPKVSLDGDPAGGLVRWPSPYNVILESR